MAGKPETRLAAVGTGLAVGGLVGLIAIDLDLTTLVSFWDDNSWLPLAFAAAFAALWTTRLRGACIAAAVAAVVLWLAVAYTPLTAAAAEGLVRRDPLRAADAAFVFGSRVQEDGEPTSDAMSRLLKGLELVATGRTARLIVSEQEGVPPYAALARAWASEFAPSTEVLAVGPIRNTREEAQAVARLFRERGFTRVLAVTSPVHTRRAAAALEQAGLEVVAVPSVETRYDLETLDRAADRRRGFGSIAHERIGLLVYGWRGWLAR